MNGRDERPVVFGIGPDERLLGWLEGAASNMAVLRCQLPRGQTLAAGTDLGRLKLAYLNRVTRDNLRPG